MVEKDKHPLPETARRQMARLYQLHLETHAMRIARRFGVTDRYVRQQWHERALNEMATLREALKALEDGEAQQ
jgi:hypothetical protein